MHTQYTTRRLHGARSMMMIVGLAAVALLFGCGGGSAEDAVSQELSAQQHQEAAALQRAHQLNANAMSKIKGERAVRSAQSN